MFADEAEKKNKLKDITSFNKKSLIIKPKVKISEKDYTLIKEQLVREISIYKDYILNNYSDNLDIFPFYRKKVIAYLTQGISKEVFEFRIHSYVTTDDDYSITLKHHFYDFYPSYAYNLEEITNDLFSWVVLAFDRRRLSYSNPFTVESIHRELVSRYINNANENQITEFVKFLLKFKRFNFRSKLERAEYDLAAHLDSDYYIFEIFYRQSKSLDNMTKKISSLTKLSNESKICFIFIVYPGREVASLLKQKNILFYNIFDLCDEFFKVDNSIVLHWYIKPLLFKLQIQDNLIQKLGESLINRLINCPEGEKNWSDYEKIGVDTFKFLFQDNFKKFLSEEQVENDLKNHRRDLLVNNNFKDPSSIWAEAKIKYNSSAIIIDFKNYSKKLNSSTLFSVSKYTKKNVGDFAIVFCRKGIDKTAEIEQRDLLRNGKLLLVFKDDEIIDMIREKMIGEDPIDRLESKKFNLIKKI